MAPDKHPRRLLTSTCIGKRKRGRFFRTIRDSFIDGLGRLISDVDVRGDASG